MKRILIFLSLTALCFSCAFHEGAMTGSAALTNGDFRIVDFVSGTAKTTHILGIGGLKPTALVLDAKKNMYLNHPLENGQVYANVTVDFKRSFFPFVGTTIATVSADLIEFSPDGEGKDIFSKLDSLKQTTKTLNEIIPNYVESNDSVGVYVFGKLDNMKFNQKTGRKSYRLIARDSVAFIFQEKSLYQTQAGVYKFEHQLDVGDLVELIERGAMAKGTIVGVNTNTAIIKMEDDLIERRISQIKISKP